MISKHTETTKIFKALCDENRLLILDILKIGEKCACHLLEDLNITQSTLSHHLRILCDSGFVESRKDGKWIYYSIHSKGIHLGCEILAKYMNTLETIKKCE
ncbi:MAG: winged helix-turn-helix transcriptional regulator [Oscillospiraceae bacterium]|nr:winged helix-turn-helix transcriptional regulator [Oscillospiraceae bacterium]